MALQMAEQILPGSEDCVDGQDQTVIDNSCITKDAAMSQPESLPLASYTPPQLVSGAGHDALALSELTKVQNTNFLY